MKQRELKELLNEAADPNTPWQRKNQIQIKLKQQASIWLIPVIDKLYLDTIRNRPELLPSLFPFFAIICGDPESGSRLADIDWSLM